MIFVTMQWVLLFSVPLLLLWSIYLVAWPAASREVEDHPHPAVRGFVHVLTLLEWFVAATGTWSFAFSLYYMRNEVALNLVPGAVVLALALHSTCRLVRRVTPHSLLLHSAFLVPLFAVLVLVDQLDDLSLVVVPFAAFFAAAFVLEVPRRTSRKAEGWLDSPLLERPGFYLRVTDTRLFLALLAVSLVEVLFQVEGFSLLDPFVPA
ncbi:MAG: hypothetical protein Kow0069_35840 [Promethearchaeota archaeon]